MVYNILKNYDHIIWDWNGTLLEDIDVVLDILGDMLVEGNLPIPSLAEYRNTFCFPIIDYYKKLGFQFDYAGFEKISHGFVRRYDSSYKEKSQLFHGTRELLEKLFQEGKSFSILSAAEHGHLNEAVRHFGLDHYMTHIFGIDSHHGESKISRGQELLKHITHARDKIIMVGDTDHDHEVAQNLGIDSLLIADGHQSYERLQETGTKVLLSRY